MKAEVKYDWDVKWLTRETLSLGDELTKMAARETVKETRRGLIRHPDIKLRRGSRGLLGTIRYKKSKYGNGYIAGVFSRQSADKWEKTFGAQAHFLEYGHAAPGYGKYSSIMGGRANKILESRGDKLEYWIRRRAGRNRTKYYRYKFEEIKKHVEERPFIRPAMKRAKKKIEHVAPRYVRSWVLKINNKGQQEWVGVK